MHDLIDEVTTAERLGISRGTLANWRCSRTDGPRFVKIGRLVRYRASDLEAYIVKRTVDPSLGRVA